MVYTVYTHVDLQVVFFACLKPYQIWFHGKMLVMGKVTEEYRTQNEKERPFMMCHIGCMYKQQKGNLIVNLNNKKVVHSI